MSQIGFLFEQKYCIGCQACQMACQVRNQTAVGLYPRVADNADHKLIGPFISLACNHCEAPACLAGCPVGALQKREDDGIVTHDLEVCTGCMICVNLCPYGACKENADTGKIIKCDLCVARLDNDDEPACVLSCPLKVLTVGTLEENEAAGGVQEGVGFTIEPTGPSTRFIPI
ncbi:MAG: 4Fe-4S dicluster domain-containing protein [Eggerthellaceae bacterium]|jgi:anaerobic dimethyl sulfoxide reductase subunit B (iron-sulfur subunit)|nr:4Fe-4S dicluster domain-containing protein [Eggerthellaceae bacterium]MDR2721385.1 4Fe-4S dicluster domain-containing protein [Coriobacteriaceae bacterium]